MRKITLGVVIDQRLHAGGGFQQALNAAVLVNQLAASEGYAVIFFTTALENVAILHSMGIKTHYLPLARSIRCVLKFRQKIQSPSLMRWVQKLFGANYFEKFFIRHGIDLVYFTSPSGWAISLEKTNYIFTVWDLCHRDDVEFPEVRINREFEAREKLYKQILPKATATIVDSLTGKLNVVRRYAVDQDRVHIIPFSPATGTLITECQYQAGYIDIKEKYSLKFDYVFYPAQFWSHKNHAYLLYGLKLLEERYGILIGAIFAGGDAGGNLEYIKQVVQKLGLADRIRFAGFVPNEEMPYLYRQSKALVMPTYFGPTNLPPLEAFYLGVPVLYPDKPGLKDQVGDAALLMDLRDPISLANQLARLIQDQNLQNELVHKGRMQFDSLSKEPRLNILVDILREFSARRVCWVE